ncbi:redox-regulated ATPase YchF [Myxococcota bacterium]|nr:redox-regulated ATPase YchF [Myxococcota bacterium]
MAIRCGIVGLPNVGKSTLFNALTSAGIAAENYPFCTIEPNSGVEPVPDTRLLALDRIVNSAQVVPASIEFVDIAGLVRGASQGEGLGNQFLGHIRETHAIIHVLRCFQDSDVTHVDGDTDPMRDVSTIETELGLADLETVDRRTQRIQKLARAGGKDGDLARQEATLLNELTDHLSDGKPARTFNISEECKEIFQACHLLTAKPILYVANVDEETRLDDPLVEAVKSHAAQTGSSCIPISGKIEAELSELETVEKSLFLKDMGLEEPGLNALIRAAYELLSLITYFTAGPKEIRAWTIRKGTRAPKAAGEIHTDFERGFIRAEVIPFELYMKYNGEMGAKAAGKMRVEGKDYVVSDGDVMLFRVGT